MNTSISDRLPFTVKHTRLTAYCRANGIRKLAVFGSALGDSFRADSDIDMLVLFPPGRRIGLFAIARMERELSGLFGGRMVDLRTPGDLHISFRDRVIKEAAVLYDGT